MNLTQNVVPFSNALGQISEMNEVEKLLIETVSDKIAPIAQSAAYIPKGPSSFSVSDLKATKISQLRTSHRERLSDPVRNFVPVRWDPY